MNEEDLVDASRVAMFRYKKPVNSSWGHHIRFCRKNSCPIHIEPEAESWAVFENFLSYCRTLMVDRHGNSTEDMYINANGCYDFTFKLIEPEAGMVPGNITIKQNDCVRSVVCRKTLHSPDPAGPSSSDAHADPFASTPAANGLPAADAARPADSARDPDELADMMRAHCHKPRGRSVRPDGSINPRFARADFDAGSIHEILLDTHAPRTGLPHHETMEIATFIRKARRRG